MPSFEKVNKRVRIKIREDEPMKKLTVNEVLEYAIKIEKESYDFYENSRKVLKDDELKSLVTLLMRQEEEHLKSLKALLKDSQKKSSFKALINVDSSKLTQIIQTEEITEDTNPIDILNVALEREINTKNNYDMFLDLVKMDDNLIDTFEMLRDKEEEHIRIIKRKINEL